MTDSTQSSELLPCVEQEPRRPARASVIWMHGLGADGNDFAPIVPELGVDDLDLRFVFPHAPRMPVTVNMGMVMPAWYDITSLSERGHDEPGIRRSAEHIERLIAREIERGIPSEKILLAGFSQGGAMALFTGLRHAERLAGIIVLSAYLLLPDQLGEASPANRETPIFQAHGIYDPVVPSLLGRKGYDLLVEDGRSIVWHEYPMQHQVCLEEIEALGAWIRERLG